MNPCIRILKGHTKSLASFSNWPDLKKQPKQTPLSSTFKKRFSIQYVKFPAIYGSLHVQIRNKFEILSF